MRFLLILSISILFVLNCGKNDLLIPESAASGGIKISTGSNRIEINKWGDIDALKSYCDGNAEFLLRSGVAYFMAGGSSERVVISTNGIVVTSPAHMNTTNVYEVNGIQVVGAQQSAIEDASGQIDTEKKLNLLLEACREHGLIAQGEQLALSEN